MPQEPAHPPEASAVTDLAPATRNERRIAGLVARARAEGGHRVSVNSQIEITDEVKEGFLILLREHGGNIERACKASGINRRTWYSLRTRDPAFAEAFLKARDDGVEALEDEALRRGMQGTKKPVFHKGEVVGHITEYSDILLIFMLKALRPQKYRDNIGARGGDSEKPEPEKISKEEVAAVRERILRGLHQARPAVPPPAEPSEKQNDPE